MKLFDPSALQYEQPETLDRVRSEGPLFPVVCFHQTRFYYKTRNEVIQDQQTVSIRDTAEQHEQYSWHFPATFTVTRHPSQRTTSVPSPRRRFFAPFFCRTTHDRQVRLQGVRGLRGSREVGDAEGSQGRAGDCRCNTWPHDRDDQAQGYQYATVHDDGGFCPFPLRSCTTVSENLFRFLFVISRCVGTCLEDARLITL